MNLTIPTIRLLGLLFAINTFSPQISAIAQTSDIPIRPETITYDELNFRVPDGTQHQHKLSNGATVYIAEDHTFPLIQIDVMLRQGSYLESKQKFGLSSLTGSLLRSGGTLKMTPEVFDEEVEFVAASISSYGSGARAGATLSCITPELKTSLDLFFDMLRTPRFDETRLGIEKRNLLEMMGQRNDDADNILNREWDFLLYGKQFYFSRRTTQANLENIKTSDLMSFHKKYRHPKFMTFAISGDVNTREILEKLEGYLANWPDNTASMEWPPPLPNHKVVPGVYSVEKDIPQGKVLIGHLVPHWKDWKNQDRASLQVMQHILGGSGFTSRIMQRIRSDEGLAYSARSRFDFDPFKPGTFVISFQSKNPTVALAAKIALEEVKRIQTELISKEELNVAKNALIDTFPRRFESASQRVRIFANDNFIGRSHNYWQNWQKQIREVSASDVLQVSKEYLNTDEIVLLVIGNWEEIEQGDPEKRANMTAFFNGNVTKIPLRNPLTLQ